MSFLKGGSFRSVKPAIWNNVLSLGSLRLNKLHSSLNYTVILNIALDPDSLRLNKLHSSLNYTVILNNVLSLGSLRLNRLHSSLNYTVILNNVLSFGSLRLNKLHSSLNYILLSTALTEIFSLTLVQNALIFCWPIGMLIFWYYGNCRIAPSETSKNIYSVQGKIKLPSKRKFNLEKG